MSETVEQSPRSLLEVIEQFVRGRLDAKLEKLNADETEKRKELEKAHETSAWIADAARRVTQIQLATHIVKPLHPDARGTSLRARPKSLAGFGLLGSGSLPENQVEDDVVGNAAALDVFKFLKLEWAGSSVLARVLAGDSEFAAILSSDLEQREALRAAFASVAEGETSYSTHTLAKQLYCPLVVAGEYHLLAPLFPTSLVHCVYAIISEDRFGEASKAARAAKGADAPFAHGYREYPNLAIQKFGGTKPQNISQLNSERRGENLLLPCLPPNWDADPVKAPLHCESVFGTRFGRSREARELLTELREFLETTTHNNVNIRRKRARLVDAICALAHDFAAGVQALEPGWSLAPECELHVSEQHWLDPNRAALDSEFAAAHGGNWTSVVAHRFANWFNQALNSERLNLSEDEHQQWASDFGEGLTSFLTDLEDARA